MISSTIRKIARPVGIVTVAAVPSLALADSAAAVTAITGYQTDALAVAAALLAMGVAIWAAMALKKKFFPG